MADTTTAANNKAVSFGGKVEREMPMESKAQNAAMHSAAAGKSTIGIPKTVAKKFVAESHGQNVKKLPKHVRKTAKNAMKRGMISEKAAKRHLGDY
jgi:GMP synthase-like glutamine amidotransferase